MSAPLLAAEPATPVRVLCDSGWQLSDPPGFTLVEGESPSCAYHWEAAFDEKVGAGKRAVALRHRETIRASVVDQGGRLREAILSASKAKRGCLHPGEDFVAQLTRQAGRHYGHRTLLVACRTREARPFERHYYLVFGEEAGAPAVELSYEYEIQAAGESAKRALARSRYKTPVGPRFKSFRLVQGTLKPNAAGMTPAGDDDGAPPLLEGGAAPLLRQN